MIINKLVDVAGVESAYPGLSQREILELPLKNVQISEGNGRKLAEGFQVALVTDKKGAEAPSVTSGRSPSG